jgi:hypothetical protein
MNFEQEPHKRLEFSLPTSHSITIKTAVPSNRDGMEVETNQHDSTACGSGGWSFFVFFSLHHSLLQGEFLS